MVLAALLLRPAQILDLTFPARPVSQIVATIAKATGTPLTVDAFFEDEILALRLRKVTPQNALNRLVTTLGAKWTAHGSTLTLSPRDGQLAEERSLHETLVLKRLQEIPRPSPNPPFDAPSLAKTLAPIFKEGNFTVAESNKADNTLHSQTPGQRLGRAIDAYLTPSLLHSMGEGHLVFRTIPNPRQRPIPAPLAQAFREFIRETNALKDELPDFTEFAWSNWGNYAELEIVADVTPNGQSLFYRVFNAQNHLNGGLDGNHRAIPRDGQITLKPTEPLTQAGTLLLRCAEARGDDLIARLGDEMDKLDATEGTTAEKLLAYPTGLGYDVRETAGLLTILPTDPFAWREGRVPRRAFRGWISLPRFALPDLGAYFGFAKTFPNPSPYLAYWLKQRNAPAPWDSTFLPFASEIPQNRLLRLDSLPPTVAATIRRLVLERGPGDHSPSQLTICADAWTQTPDPTDALPHGLPDDTLLKLSDTNAPGYVGPPLVDPTHNRPPPPRFTRRLTFIVYLEKDQTYQDHFDFIELPTLATGKPISWPFQPK